MAVHEGVIQLGPDSKATVRDGVVVVAPKDVDVSVVRLDSRAQVLLEDRGKAVSTTFTVIAKNGREIGSAELGGESEGFLSELPAVPKGGSIRVTSAYPTWGHWS